MSAAADASGLLTTAIQLGQAVGVAVFGSLFLTLDARGGPGPGVSGHAIAVTLDWAAVATALGVLAAVPLTRTVLAARRGSTPPPRLPPIGDRSRAALRVCTATAGPALSSVGFDRARGQIRRARVAARLPAGLSRYIVDFIIASCWGKL